MELNFDSLIEFVLSSMKRSKMSNWEKDAIHVENLNDPCVEGSKDQTHRPDSNSSNPH